MRLCSISTGVAGQFILRVYEAGHDTTSRGLNPNTAGSACRRLSVSASEILMKFSGGILPRNFQLLMAGRPRPNKSAAAAVPPSASTTSSTDLSMPQHSLHGVNLSRFPVQAIDFVKKSSKNRGMDTKEVIGERLRLWVLAENFTPKQVYEQIGCTKGAWSGYTNGKRRLTLDIATALREEFGISLEWILYGNLNAIVDPHLIVRMKEISDNEKRGIFIGRTRPVAMRKANAGREPKKAKTAHR